MIIQKIENKYIIKIIKKEINKFDYFNKEEIQNLFQKIISKLKEKYTIKGLLDIEVYVNKKYGMIIEIEEIEVFDDEIDLNIHFHLDSFFLEEINPIEIKNKKEVYYYDNKFYSPYTKISDSIVIYKTNEILNKGIKII